MWGVCDIGQRKREEGSASLKGNISPGRKGERYFGANVPTPALLAVVVRPRAQARFVACVRADRRPALRGQLTFVAEYFFTSACRCPAVKPLLSRP